MKVILFGATGMVGQGVLRECLLDPGVEKVLTVGRHPTGRNHPKLKEVVHGDFTDFTSLEAEWSGYDACFFCLGVSSAGMTEDGYRRVTFDFTLAAARLLAGVNPGMVFIYVTGMGTDGTEKGRVMWARVKGATENALLALPFRASYMFRPGAIQPLDGIHSRTPWVRGLLPVLAPLFPLLKRLFPRQVTTTREIGRAMIRAAREGAPKRILESWDIHLLGREDPE
jgi:uncharacterized protein YbjT (DUF2867 family)